MNGELHVTRRLQTRRVHMIETSVESQEVVCDDSLYVISNKGVAYVASDNVPANAWYFFRPSLGCLCTTFLV